MKVSDEAIAALRRDAEGFDGVIIAVLDELRELRAAIDRRSETWQAPGFTVKEAVLDHGRYRAAEAAEKNTAELLALRAVADAAAAVVEIVSHEDNGCLSESTKYQALEAARIDDFHRRADYGNRPCDRGEPLRGRRSHAAQSDR